GWWATRRSRTVRSRRSPARRFPTTARRAWRDSESNFVEDLSPLDSPDGRAWNPSDKDLQRAEGSGRMVLRRSEKGTRIMDVFERAAIRIMFPRKPWLRSDVDPRSATRNPRWHMEIPRGAACELSTANVCNTRNPSGG